VQEVRGLARTLTLLGFQAARAEDYEIGILHSSPMAFSLYEKMGFGTAETFAIYAPPTGFHM
jgi:predicted N-acetyltransferase YhbS